jgi:hypothetical protein
MTDADDRREELRARTTWARLLATGAFSLTTLVLTNARDLKKLRRTRPLEARYVRPPRSYALPAHEPWMRVCASREKYLRPTRYCNPRAPEIVAMAHHLGAYRLPDHEFAERAFHFCKERMELEIGPIDGVEATLQRGTGTCFQLISVFIALCRAAGIKARYKLYAVNMIEAWRETMIDADPLVRKWYDAMGYFLIEGEGEAFVDGRWTVAHVGPTAARQAAAGIPITRFGEDALGVWFFARPGTIMRPEAVPRGLGAGSRLLHRLSPGSMERINVSVQKQIERGLAVLAQAGGPRAYDASVRKARGLSGPAVDLRPREGIVFRD